jgi:MFS family permease
VPRWAEFTGLSGYNFLAMVRRGFFYTFLMLYLRERLELPVTAVALIGAVNAISSTLGQLLVWGRYSDRKNLRARLMVLGEFIAGLGYLLTFALYRVTLDHVSPTTTLTLILVCLGTIEFFWSMTDVGFRAAIAQVTQTGNRGRFLGLIELVGLLGVGAGLLLAGELYDNGDGFENGHLWFLASGFILAGVPLIKMTLSHLDRVTVGNGDDGLGGRLTSDYRRYMAALAVAVVGLWCFQQNHSYFVRLADTAAADDRELSFIRTAFWVTGGLTALLAGVVLDRIGARRSYLWSLFLCALVPLSFLFTESVLFAVVSLSLFGIFLVSFRTASYALAADLAPPESRGRYFAVYNAVMSMGWGLAALLLGGPVADLLMARGQSDRDAYAATFIIGAALGGVGLILFLLFVRRGSGGPPPAPEAS